MADALDTAFARRIVPVITIDGVEEAETLGRALLDGGLPVAEVTLRTPGALAALRRLVEEPALLVGAGTVLAPEQVEVAADAGARYLVSPGLLDTIADRSQQVGVPLLPGAVTATEAMRARERGFRTVKFFPAGTSGGPAAIAALAAPLYDLRFVPTGGVSQANLGEYLGLDAVPAAGGSWMVPRNLLATGDVAQLTRSSPRLSSSLDSLGADRASRTGFPSSNRESRAG